MTLAVILYNSADGQEIPCLTMPTVADAESFLTDIFGPADGDNVWGQGRVAQFDNHFFTSYYDGYDNWGDIISFSVREVQHARPIVGFRVD